MLSNSYDARRSIFVKHFAKNVRDHFADGELRTDITPYELAKLIYRNRLEIPVSEIVKIYAITQDDLELTVEDITDDVFELANSGYFDRPDRYGDAEQRFVDRAKEARFEGAV